MSSLTDRLRLKRHTLSDQFAISDYTGNWNLIDGAPGTFICTSGTRPADWTALQTGRSIVETDTGLRWRWSGTVFVREGPKGLVTHAERLTQASSTSYTYATVLATSSVSYTNRRHLVVVEAPLVWSTGGLTGLAIFRDSTMLNEWVHQGSTGAAAANYPRGMSFVTTDTPPGGNSLYSLQFKLITGYAGTCYVEGATNKPVAVTTVEI